MKKGLATLLVIMVLFATVFASSDTFTLVQSEYPIYVNGSEFDTGDLPPLNYEGNTYLPLRKVAEATGNDVDFVDNQIKLINSKRLTATNAHKIDLYASLCHWFSSANTLLSDLKFAFDNGHEYTQSAYAIDLLKRGTASLKTNYDLTVIEMDGSAVCIYDYFMNSSDMPTSFSTAKTILENNFGKETVDMVLYNFGDDFESQLIKLENYISALEAMSSIPPVSHSKNDAINFSNIFDSINSMCNDPLYCTEKINILSNMIEFL